MVMYRGLLYHYRHWRRYQEIINTLMKSGFTFFVERFDLPGIPLYKRLKGVFRLTGEEPGQFPRKVVKMLEELGPAFVKLGQLLSTRIDLLPEPFLEELKLLQDHVPSIPYQVVEKVFCDEHKKPLTSVFASFEKEPLASASIGQVHKGILLDGREVVVKVQRPGIERVMKTDFEIMIGIGQYVEKRTWLGQVYKFTEMLEELSSYVFEELDFTLEGRNAEILKSNFEDDPYIYVPAVYWEYTTSKILVMEYVEGHKINNKKQLEDTGINSVAIARKLTDAMIKQIFLQGFFHSDPHPGNLAVLPGNKIVFMDFGQVGQISEELREAFVEIILAMVKHDVDRIIKVLSSTKMLRKNVNLSKLKHDIGRLERKYYGLPLSRIEIGPSIQEFLQVLYHHQVQVPSDLTMAMKALITLEGVVRELAPEMNLAEIAESFAEKIYKKHYFIDRLEKQFRKRVTETAKTISQLPLLTENVLNKLGQGEISFVVEHKDLLFMLEKLHKALNRLIISIMLASLLIVFSVFIRVNPQSFFINMHIPEILFGLALGFSILLIIVCSFGNRN